MLIHGLIDSSRVNGPGLRAVLFLQGCKLGCRGCWNPGTHAFTGNDRAVDEIAAWVLQRRRHSGIEGVTLSGGEPMHQVSDLCRLVESVKAAAPDISFGMFSGYSERELSRGRFWTRADLTEADRSQLWLRLLDRLDFAVLGRFVATQPTLSPLRTSLNQSLRLITSRYTDADFDTHEVEVTIEPAGLVQVTGFPTSGLPA